MKDQAIYYPICSDCTVWGADTTQEEAEKLAQFVADKMRTYVEETYGDEFDVQVVVRRETLGY